MLILCVLALGKKAQKEFIEQITVLKNMVKAEIECKTAIPVESSDLGHDIKKENV